MANVFGERLETPPNGEDRRLDLLEAYLSRKQQRRKLKQRRLVLFLR